MLGYTAATIIYPSECNQLNLCADCFIHTQDINDNTPVFEEPFYPVSTPENTPAGTVLTTVTATDDDIGMNGQIVYSIEASNPLIEVDNMTGQITLIAVPDFEVIQALIVEV